jgi:hypothetical protein
MSVSCTGAYGRVVAGRYKQSSDAAVWLLMSLLLLLSVVCDCSVAEAGKVFRRPGHHLQMVNHVLVHHGIAALHNIENRPDVAAEASYLQGTLSA